MNLKQRAKQLTADVPVVFMCLKHKETPLVAKLLAALTVVYALSPIDLIPDFIPVLGYLDDLIILPALIALTIRLIPKEVFDQCRLEAQGLWSDGRPKRWYYALPIGLIWLILLAYILFKIIKYF